MPFAEKMDKDAKYMLKAIELAKKGLGKTSPNPAVGCVIVKKDKIIGEGFHKRFGGSHAEVEALDKAGKKAKGAAIYVNLEPCAHFGKTPPCVDAIIKSEIKKVIIAMQDPNPLNNGKGIKKLRSAGIEVKVGVCKKQAQELNAPFIKYIKQGLPYVTLKLAQSLDGKIVTKTGDSKWISCEESRRLVHRLRSEVDAVIVGSGTVIRDDPWLTARPGIRYQSIRVSEYQSIRTRQPIKIIVDSKLKIPLNAKVLSKESPAKTIVATTRLAPKNKVEKILKKNTEILFMKDKSGRINLKALMKALASRGITNIMIEGGGELAASAMEEGVVDRILFFIAPKIIGNKAKVLQATIVNDLTVRKIGYDYLLEGYL
jgi:diaminohydroxyphosphoribosylaminopyrimidine deaminase / 5-amino-6-(5-phosphoribosylamino)uracil reductase